MGNLKELCKMLPLTEQLHCPYYSQPSGKIERASFKIFEFPWPKLLPLPLTPYGLFPWGLISYPSMN